MTDISGLLRVLAGGGVEFIVVGGIAASAHGSPRLTEDVDIVYRRSEENIERLARALSDHEPYPRDAPPGLPFQWDAETIRHGLNFTLMTSLGALVAFGEIVGGGNYDELLPHSLRADAFGVSCRCLDLPTLIRVKRAAGRPKDFEAIAELEALLEEEQRADDE